VIAIGLGGNVGGEPAVLERFRRAREALAQLGDVRSAALYRTAPIGPEQPAFLNSVVRLRVDDALPAEILATVLEIERLCGRERRTETRWGPRAIDLDILLWDERIIELPQLQVPHPRLVERRFVLRPLIDLFGEDLVVPGTKQTLGALEQRTRGQAVEEIATTW